MEASMADESPATKADIQALGDNLRVFLKEELSGLRTDIERRIDGLERRIDGLEQRIDGLGQRIDGLGQRIDGLGQRIDGLEQRIDGLERRVEERLLEVEVKLTKRMDDFAASLEEQIRDSQTEVLKAMLTTQESNLARFKEIEPLRERIAILERRLLEIEMKLHIPPAA
jgi:chromosome segregation ATPase